jgi:hypothetical protein
MTADVRTLLEKPHKIKDFDGITRHLDATFTSHTVLWAATLSTRGQSENPARSIGGPDQPRSGWERGLKEITL